MMISYIKQQKFDSKPLIFSIVLLLTVVNPLVENIEFYSPVAYMIAHYIVYFSGIYIGYKYFKSNLIILIIGLIPAILWHIPYFFALGAAFVIYRIILEITLFLGGLFVGSAIKYIKFYLKITLFALWMLGDSALAIIFIVSDPIYSNVDYRFSPYPLSSLPLAGVAMFIVMNIFLAYVLSKYIKSLLG